jgi:hypothetical protein
MKWVLILGCFGFVVGPAGAGERWPAKYCAELGKLRAILETGDTPVARAHERFGVLLLQQTHCGMDVQAIIDADNAELSRAEAPREKSVRTAPRPRQPMLCDTTPKAYGGSYIDCF